MKKEYGIEAEKENRGKFIFFKDTNAYGGSQLWYREVAEGSRGIIEKMENINKYNSACGSVAVANVLFYLNKTNFQISKKQFIDLVTDLYENYIEQTLHIGKLLGMGVWSINAIERGVKKYSRKQGLDLESYKCSNKTDSFDEAKRFIKTALEKNQPVIMLLWLGEYIRKLEKEDITSEIHYVTITGMQEEDNDFSVILSNCGRRTKVDSFRKLWISQKMFYRITDKIYGNVSLIYFDKGY